MPLVCLPSFSFPTKKLEGYPANLRPKSLELEQSISASALSHFFLPATILVPESTHTRALATGPTSLLGLGGEDFSQNGQRAVR